VSRLAEAVAELALAFETLEIEDWLLLGWPRARVQVNANTGTSRQGDQENHEHGTHRIKKLVPHVEA
jgi:hypothetical protein